MMSIDDFRAEAHQLVDWIADYYRNISQYPVKSQVTPGDIASRLPASPPLQPESFKTVFADVERIILPGITHWQSPSFFAYFPANTSFPSLLGEFLTAALGVQGMKWETSPAATELEETVMKWLRQMTGLPDSFEGVIQDSASSATLCAVLTAREKASAFAINEKGFQQPANFRVYASSEAHSSVDKAIRIAGLGHENLKKIPVDQAFSMDTWALQQCIETDIRQGYKPLCVVAALGTTGSTGVDKLEKIAALCRKFAIWLHVDAAYAGSALILPEYRWMINGISLADSIVFNPHKWLFTNFDCSAYFVRDKDALIETFQLVPEYLKSQVHTNANDYSNWGVQLGRRFRALKLWFVIRMFGVTGLQEKLRYQLSLAQDLEAEIVQSKTFELVAPRLFNLVCFRFIPDEKLPETELDRLNETLLLAVNKTGKAYLTHTRLNGKYTIRMVIAQTNVTARNVTETWQLLKEKSEEISHTN